MRFVFMSHCKANNGTRQVGTTFYFLHLDSFKLYFMFWPRDWLYKTDYYRNLARFIEPSAGRNQWLFYA